MSFGGGGFDLNGSEKLRFLTPLKHYRQEHILGLHYLIYVFVAKAQQGNNWVKTRLRLKLFWNNANTGFEEYQSRMIQSCQMWFFSPSSVKWNFCRKRPDSAKCFSSNKSHFSDRKWFYPSCFQSNLQLTLSWARFIPLLNMFPCNRDIPKALGKESKQLRVLQRVEVALARRVRCPATTNPVCDVTPFQVSLPLSKTLKRALIDWTQLLLKSPAYASVPVKMQGTGGYERRRWNEERGESRKHARAGKVWARGRE